MNVVSIAIGALGVVLALGFLVETIVSSLLHRHMEQMDDHIRSILDAHYERTVLLIRHEIERSKMGD